MKAFATVLVVVLVGLGPARAISNITTCTAQEVVDMLPVECHGALAAALLHTSPSSVNFTEAEFDTLCESGCVGLSIAAMERCYGEQHELTINMIHVSMLCDIDERGERCFVQYGAVEVVLNSIRASCLMADGGVPDTCMQSCTSALQSSNGQIGCCVNTGNITGLYKPELNSSLWAGCGVDTPGFCTFSAAMPLVQYSSLLLVFLVMLVPVLLG